MKKILYSFFLLTSAWNVNAQIVVTNNQTATQLTSLIVATAGNLGVVISNETLTCDATANGELLGPGNLGINNGIVLGSGQASSLVGLPASLASDMMSTPGDAMLGAMVAASTYDACVLEFDIAPVGNFMEFEYVFGSEEYPEFNCSSFNDVFGFFISGPGFAQPTNIALIPATVLPVAINTINDGTGGCSTYQNLYVNNTDTFSTMDGFTTPLIAHVNVTPAATYHLKLAIADVADGIMNSYVVLKANSLKSGNTTPSGVSQLEKEGIGIYPTAVDQLLNIENRSGEAWSFEILQLNGSSVYRNSIQQQQNKNSFDISKLSRGVYVLKMIRNSDGKVVNEKIVKL